MITSTLLIEPIVSLHCVDDSGGGVSETFTTSMLTRSLDLLEVTCCGSPLVMVPRAGHVRATPATCYEVENRTCLPATPVSKDTDTAKSNHNWARVLNPVSLSIQQPLLQQFFHSILHSHTSLHCPVVVLTCCIILVSKHVTTYKSVRLDNVMVPSFDAIFRRGGGNWKVTENVVK